MDQRRSLRRAVRHDLALDGDELARKKPRRTRQSPPSLLRVATVVALLWSIGTSTVSAQAPYRQEVIPGFSSLYVARGDNSPKLVDLDDDGDLDAVVGEIYGSLRYFENKGSSEAPSFVEATGGANPFSSIDVGIDSDPDLVDLDGDGDFDAVVGEFDGSLLYFENTGSPDAPIFVEATGDANPFAAIDVGQDSSPSPDLVDLDGDGDLDAIVGEFLGSLLYFENIGTPGAPDFVEASGSTNPFSGIDIGGFSSPSPELVDLPRCGRRSLEEPPVP